MFFGMTMNMKAVGLWNESDLFSLFIMWAIMMAGMMLPSATPVILLVDKLNFQRKMKEATYTHSLYFVVGYLLAWILYSALITLVQWGLHSVSLLSPMMSSSNDVFSGVLLIVAGFYQWSTLKLKCLQLCRSPLNMLTTQWREGILGAITLGFKHGQYCLACCWFLMALLFVTGVMNLKWILVLTLLVMIEKCLPRGDVISKALGCLLISLGLVILLY
jgi:predicted metal-binding membrane protein